MIHIQYFLVIQLGGWGNGSKACWMVGSLLTEMCAGAAFRGTVKIYQLSQDLSINSFAEKYCYYFLV